MALSRGTGLGGSGLSDGLPNLGGSGGEDRYDPTSGFAPGANSAWDFINNYARFKDVYYGPLANTPGWTFTRASTGYYTTTGGVLVPFASGSLRTGDRGALIEGAGTNLCLQSQTFDSASWTKSGATTVTTNSTVAPDGTTTADTINNVGTVGDRVTQNIVATATSSHVFSCFLKAGVGSVTTLILRNNTTATNIAAGAFTLTGAGSASSVIGTATITRLASTDWYLCSIASSSGVTSGDTLICYVYAGHSSSIAGHTTIAWGAQLEAASFPSSYIPTTTGSATRAADSLTVTGVTGLDYPLSLYAEFEREADTGKASGLLRVDNATQNERAFIFVNGSDLAQAVSSAGGVDQASPTVAGAIALNTVTRIAARFNTNSVRIARDGILGTEDVTATNPSSISKIEIGTTNGSSHLFGYLRRLALFSRALSDGELQALTP